MKKKYKTWMPVFQGFYGTLLEFDYYRLEDFDDVDNLNIDYKQYENDISELACNFIESECNFIKSVKFEKLISPKFYNFSNDSINCEITLDVNKLSDYINDNLEAFKDYLKDNYTSYDGFSSSYSNDVNKWRYDTDNFIEFNDGHKLGALLQFYFINEFEDINMSMYEYCKCDHDIHESNYIIES